MSILLLAGGPHGVGKTSLLHEVIKELPADIRLYDPGVLFVDHVFTKKDRTALEVEQMVSSELQTALESQPLVVSNWHYAVWTREGYVPQLRGNIFWALVRSPVVKEVYMTQITAPAEIILERRMKDAAFRKRKIDLACVTEEMAATELFFLREHAIASMYKPVVSAIISNINFEQAKGELLALCTSAYETRTAWRELHIPREVCK